MTGTVNSNPANGVPLPPLYSSDPNPSGFGQAPFGMGSFGGISVGLHGDPTYSEAQLLSGHRITDYYINVLDTQENLIGILSGIDPQSSSLTWDAKAAIHGSGQLSILDLNQQFQVLMGGSLTTLGLQQAFMNVLLAPHITLAPADGSQNVQKDYPLGIFVPSAPEQDWTSTERHWQVTLLDKLSLLDSDVMTDGANPPNAVTYSVTAGTNIVSAVIAVLNTVTPLGPHSFDSLPSAGDPAYNATTSADMTWDASTTKLKIVNDLLLAGGYFSLYCDYNGQFHITKYVVPGGQYNSSGVQTVTPLPSNKMTAVFGPNNTPYSDDPSDTGMMAPNWKLIEDYYAVPNKFVAIGVGDSNSAPPTAVATNQDPNSPYSFQNRGKWVTVTQQGVENYQQSSLQLYAAAKLQEYTNPVSEVTVDHLPLPMQMHNDVIQFINNRAGVNQTMVVTSFTAPLDPMRLWTTVLAGTIAITTQ